MQLRAWLALLPAAEFVARPWLSYWKGVSLRPTEPAFCRQPLEHAYRRFMETDDAHGAWLAWAAIFESYAMPWNDYGPVRTWLTELERLQACFPTFPSPDVEAAVVGAGTTLFLGDPFHPLLKRWAECAGALLAGTPPLHAIGPLAYFYALYHASGGEAAGVRDAKALLDRVAFAEKEHASYPFSFALYAAAQTFLCAASLRPDEAGEWVRKGLAVTAEAKQPLLDFILQLHGVHAAGMVGDARTAAAHHHAVSSLFDPTLKLQTLLYRYNEACIRLMEGEVATAREMAVRLIAPMEAAGAGFTVVLTRLLAAQALALALALEGNGPDARPYLIRYRTSPAAFPRRPWNSRPN